MKPPEPESLEPGKPAAEMTSEERQEYVTDLRRRMRAELREIERPRRQAKLRQGRVKPRTLAEAEIFAEDLLGKREKRRGGLPE